MALAAVRLDVAADRREAPAPVVRELSLRDVERWDRFVLEQPEATFCHRAGWARVLRRAFGYDTHFLYVEQGERITGVLPLVAVRSRLFGHYLVSSAFMVYGGPLYADDTARQLLTARALEIAAQCDVDYVEYRSPVPGEPTWARKSDLYVTFRRPLGRDPQALLPSAKRRAIRKAEKHGVTAHLDGDIERFYSVFATSTRNLGTPVLPRRFFQAIWEEFADDVEVLTVESAGTPVAAAMLFYFRDDAHCYYVGNTPAAFDVAASDYMWWRAMARAIERRCATFDMGRSKRNTGSFEFKRRWGVEPTPLHYEYFVRRGQVPDTNPLNPKYRLFIEGWKRLPLPVANRLGPLLIRGLA